MPCMAGSICRVWLAGVQPFLFVRMQPSEKKKKKEKKEKKRDRSPTPDDAAEKSEVCTVGVREVMGALMTACCMNSVAMMPHVSLGMASLERSMQY